MKLKRLTFHGSFEVTQRLTFHGSFEVTQRLTFHGSFEVTQRLASRVARQVTKVKIIIRRMFKFIFPIKAERK
ncbi:hypothetical protein [Leptospira noguchii]|uniref:hypothetical protein n=1 Tax=Leptospira noguchii TaxID=28182 RepID=UPI0018DEDA90|nr:hypothetical protein [Leptospira noguchii]